MLEFLQQPWHWSVGGLLIGLTVPTLLLVGNKKFGISSSLRHMCAMCVPANIPFFQYDWKKEKWNLFFVAGIVLGGWIAAQFLSNPQPIQIADQTVSALQAQGIKDFQHIAPHDIFAWQQVFSLRGFLFFVLGGFLVGFGTRYAGGCTSGHAIMGLANLQFPSLVATVSFMIGGIISTHFILPLFLS